jgi:hypothetical protein
MRYLRPRYPEFRRVLLVESGPRAVLEISIPRLRNVFGPGAAFDLITCYSGQPSTLPEGAAIWRTADYQSKPSRAALLQQLKTSGATGVAILCAGNPIMSRWKWWLVWHLPMKVLVINENADCFWLDTAHIRNARRMALARAGLSGQIAGRTMLRLACFPFGLLYLIIYASAVHARRSLRLAFGSRVPPRS